MYVNASPQWLVAVAGRQGSSVRASRRNGPWRDNYPRSGAWWPAPPGLSCDPQWQMPRVPAPNSDLSQANCRSSACIPARQRRGGAFGSQRLWSSWISRYFALAARRARLGAEAKRQSTGRRKRSKLAGRSRAGLPRGWRSDGPWLPQNGAASPWSPMDRSPPPCSTLATRQSGLQYAFCASAMCRAMSPRSAGELGWSCRTSARPRAALGASALKPDPTAGAAASPPESLTPPGQTVPSAYVARQINLSERCDAATEPPG